MGERAEGETATSRSAQHGADQSTTVTVSRVADPNITVESGMSLTLTRELNVDQPVSWRRRSMPTS